MQCQTLQYSDFLPFFNVLPDLFSASSAQPPPPNKGPFQFLTGSVFMLKSPPRPSTFFSHATGLLTILCTTSTQ